MDPCPWYLCNCKIAIKSVGAFMLHKEANHPEQIEILEGPSGGKLLQLREGYEAVELTFVGRREKIICSGKLNPPKKIQKSTIRRRYRPQNDWKLTPYVNITVPLETLAESIIRKWSNKKTRYVDQTGRIIMSSRRIKIASKKRMLMEETIKNQVRDGLKLDFKNLISKKNRELCRQLALK